MPDFIVERPPSYRPRKDARGKDTISGIDPFVMQSDGKGWLFVPGRSEDGPLPTHYEPRGIHDPESTLWPAMQSRAYGMDCARIIRITAVWRSRFPYVVTTYRLTEHHTAGGMSRWLSWLSELQPEMFCEVSPELAEERGLKNGGWATIRTMRGGN